MSTPHLPANRSACGGRACGGFSLVEVLVGLLVGLIAMVVVAQVFSVFEGQKRSTTSGGEAQINGGLALYALESSARQAGYGINDTLATGCATLMHDATRVAPALSDFTVTVRPVFITQGANGAPDALSFSYGTSAQTMSGVALTETNQGGVNGNFKIASRFGFSVGDLFLVAEANKQCSLFRATALPNADELQHTNGNYTNTSGQNVSARYNNPNRTAVDYVAGQAKVYDLGPSPIMATYAVANNQLTYRNDFDTGVATPVTDHVVSLQAIYGFDTRVGAQSSLVVDTWSESVLDADGSGVTGDAADWLRVGALRVAVITRSPQKERANTAGNCTITTAAPRLTWSYRDTAGVNQTFLDIPLTADADWQCYRYNVFETTIALRNMIWRPE